MKDICSKSEIAAHFNTKWWTNLANPSRYNVMVNDLLKMLDLNKSEIFILTCLSIPTLFFGFYASSRIF